MHAPESSIGKEQGLVALQHGNTLARQMHCGIYTRRGDTNTTGDTEMSIITPAQYGLNLKTRYDNYINGQWVAPVAGRYFENVTPVTGQVICEVARSDAADVELALDAAHAAKTAWGKTSVAQRALILHRIADRMEQWFVEGAADGFMVRLPTVPGSLERFVRLVVPELQRRGLFRKDYTGTTLRDHLGLARPRGRVTAA